MDKLSINYTVWVDSSSTATEYFRCNGQNVRLRKQLYCCMSRLNNECDIRIAP